MADSTGLENLRQSRQAATAPKRDEVLIAVLRLLNREGYRDTTMEDIAREAGVNKTTLYRWWNGKPAVVAEALAALMTVGPVPNTGDTRRDFILTTRGTIANYAQTALGVTIAALIADLSSDPEALGEFRRAFVEARRDACRVVFNQAIKRGDIPPDTDCDLVMDMVAGAVIYRRLIADAPIDESYAERFADLLLPPMVARAAQAESAGA